MFSITLRMNVWEYLQTKLKIMSFIFIYIECICFEKSQESLILTFPQGSGYFRLLVPRSSCYVYLFVLFLSDTMELD